MVSFVGFKVFDLGNFNFVRLKSSFCSGEKEGNNGVVDVILSELKMISLNANKLDLLGFVKSLETKSIILITARDISKSTSVQMCHCKVFHFNYLIV